MEGILIGIVIGLVIGGIVVLIVFGLRRMNASLNGGKTTTRGSDRSTQSRGREPEPYSEPERTPQEKVYDALYEEYQSATTREQYTSLQAKIESKRSQMTEELYQSLNRDVSNEIDAIDQEAADQAVIDAYLAKFRALKTETDKEKVFEALHQIKVVQVNDETDEPEIALYEDIESNGETEDIDWMNSTYDTLLKERLRTLILAAREGTVDDYQALNSLISELDDSGYESEDHEDVYDIIGSNYADDWNEMIVLYMRSPDWYDDFYGLDDIEEDGWTAIFKKARDEGDLLSIVLSLMKEENDNTFSEFLVEDKLKEIQTQLDTKHLAIGFRSGEEERGV